MDVEEGKILHHLLQEVHGDGQDELNNNDQVQTMIENYRNHVMKQQKKRPSNDSNKSDGFQQQNDRNNFTAGYTDNSGSKQGGHNALMSHSQPCLYSVTDRLRDEQSLKQDCTHYQYCSDPHEDNAAPTNLADSGKQPVVSTIFGMSNIDSTRHSEASILRSEIAHLKQQINVLQRKSDKLNHLERAYGKIEKEFEQVLAQRDKHEQLEKTALMKMEHQFQRMSQENDALQREVERLNALLQQHKTVQANTSDVSSSSTTLAAASGGNLSSLTADASNPAGGLSVLEQQQQQQIMQLNLILNELIPKNKELMALQDRQRLEIDAQTTTLEEQRTHIDMLEKALTNAQERLAARERQSVDAVAVMEKCTHLQKLLHESLDEKEKQHEEHTKQKAQLEMEMAQLRMQLSKDSCAFGPRAGKSPESEELKRLRKSIYTKDERISNLESSLLAFQKRYNDEMQRDSAEIETLTSKVRRLETENADKERYIQQLLDDKQRIHGQWAEERRSLDHRVRLLEQDLRFLMNGSSAPLGSPPFSLSRMGSDGADGRGSSWSVSGGRNVVGGVNVASLPHRMAYHGGGGIMATMPSSPSAFVENYMVNNGELISGGGTGSGASFFNNATSVSELHNKYGHTRLFDATSPVRQRCSAEQLPTSARAAIVHDSTMARMEELRRKIADRRASVSSGRVGGDESATGSRRPSLSEDGDTSGSRHGRHVSGGTGSSTGDIPYHSSSPSSRNTSNLSLACGTAPPMRTSLSSSRGRSRICGPPSSQNHLQPLPQYKPSNGATNRVTASEGTVASAPGGGAVVGRMSAYLEALPASTRRRLAAAAADEGCAMSDVIGNGSASSEVLLRLLPPPPPLSAQPSGKKQHQSLNANLTPLNVESHENKEEEEQDIQMCCRLRQPHRRRHSSADVSSHDDDAEHTAGLPPRISATNGCKMVSSVIIGGGDSSADNNNVVGSRNSARLTSRVDVNQITVTNSIAGSSNGGG